MQALAFIDLLGFSQMVGKNPSHSREILNDFYDITFCVIEGRKEVQGKLFSDSLLAYSNNPAELVNVVTKIYRECLKKNNTYNFNLSEFFLLPRGGISYGIVDIQKHKEAPNLSKSFIISPALVHSVEMESHIKGARLLIADPIHGNEQVFTWNMNIKNLLYENSTFTFRSKYRYFDALWFLDLNRKEEEQENEVTELLGIAIKLAKSNSDNKSAIEHHLQTLRIGLMSYCKFLTPNSNPLLERVITEFEDNKYWLIWLTLFEVIMQSPDSWAFPWKSEIIEFYKKVSLKQSWANVIKEINKPRNIYQKRLMDNFITKLSIIHV